MGHLGWKKGVWRLGSHSVRVVALFVKTSNVELTMSLHVRHHFIDQQMD
jgi:hypothetical protein